MDVIGKDRKVIQCDCEFRDYQVQCNQDMISRSAAYVRSFREEIREPRKKSTFLIFVFDMVKKSKTKRKHLLFSFLFLTWSKSQKRCCVFDRK